MMAEIERNLDYVSANLLWPRFGSLRWNTCSSRMWAPAPLGKYTRPQLVYLVGVAADLCNMCIRPKLRGRGWTMSPR